MDRKAKAALHLMRGRDWELAVVVFSATDWMQHFFMHEFMAAAEKEGTEIAKAYIAADRFLGEVLAMGCDVLIVSDHGFAPARRKLYLNSLLRDGGLLRERPHLLGRHAASILSPLSPVMPLLKKAGKALNAGITLLPGADVCERIDLKGSAAFLFSNDGGVALEDAARAEEVRQAILGAKDWECRPMVREVYRREDIYSGPETGKAPALLVIPEDDVLLSTTLASGTSSPIEPGKEKDGTHRKIGVFIAWGDGFRAQGEIRERSVMDVAPTILSYFSTDVPGYMDGTAIGPGRRIPGKKLLGASTRAALRRMAGSQ